MSSVPRRRRLRAKQAPPTAECLCRRADWDGLADVLRTIYGCSTLYEVAACSRASRRWNAAGRCVEMAALHGLRDTDPRVHLRSLKILETRADSCFVAREVSMFLSRCYNGKRDFDSGSDYRGRVLAAQVIGQAKGHGAVRFLLDILNSEKENSVDVFAAAAEGVGVVGLLPEEFAAVVELPDKWNTLQILLSALRHNNVPNEQAEAILPIGDRILSEACLSVEEAGPDDQYLIADCVEVLARAGSLCGHDPTASFKHLRAWSSFVDTDAVLSLSERVGDIRFLLSEPAARIIYGVLSTRDHDQPYACALYQPRGAARRLPVLREGGNVCHRGRRGLKGGEVAPWNYDDELDATAPEARRCSTRHTEGEQSSSRN